MPPVFSPLSRRLYLRIWLAVVLAVMVVTLLFAWLWRLEIRNERGPGAAGREVLVRNAQGEVLGRSTAPPIARSSQGVEFEVPLYDGGALRIKLTRPKGPPPGGPWWRPPFDLAWVMGLVALAVTLGAYPVVRRLTQRLEALQRGVERWGEGDLARRLPEDGQDEVAFLAGRFNIAAQRVQAMLHSHKALLANASHELRSPLTRIRMGLELMGATPTPAWRDEIARNIRELDQLIDEILLASRLDVQPDNMGPLEPVELGGLCAEECAAAGAEFDVAPAQLAAVQVQGSAKLLRRCVRNLLDNARRHAGGDGVVLELRHAEGAVLVRVCDRGPGVPPALREHIFEPFYRLPGASERDGGVGLGLALVKTIAERHGGGVHCEDRPGGGACFVVRLPGTLPG